MSCVTDSQQHHFPHHSDHKHSLCVLPSRLKNNMCHISEEEHNVAHPSAEPGDSRCVLTPSPQTACSSKENRTGHGPSSSTSSGVCDHLTRRRWLFFVLVTCATAITVGLGAAMVVASLSPLLLLLRLMYPPSVVLAVDNSNLTIPAMCRELRVRYAALRDALLRSSALPRWLEWLVNRLKPQYRLPFLLRIRRNPQRMVIVGSKVSAAAPAWRKCAAAAGFDVVLNLRVQRGVGYRGEEGVDEQLHKVMANAALVTASAPLLRRLGWYLGAFPRPVLIQVSGDGNNNLGKGGFPQQVRHALRIGMDVEVVAWRASMSSVYPAMLVEWRHSRPWFSGHLRLRYLDDMPDVTMPAPECRYGTECHNPRCVFRHTESSNETGSGDAQEGMSPGWSETFASDHHSSRSTTRPLPEGASSRINTSSSPGRHSRMPVVSHRDGIASPSVSPPPLPSHSAFAPDPHPHARTMPSAAPVPLRYARGPPVSRDDPSAGNSERNGKEWGRGARRCSATTVPAPARVPASTTPTLIAAVPAAIPAALTGDSCNRDRSVSGASMASTVSSGSERSESGVSTLAVESAPSVTTTSHANSGDGADQAESPCERPTVVIPESHCGGGVVATENTNSTDPSQQLHGVEDALVCDDGESTPTPQPSDVKLAAAAPPHSDASAVGTGSGFDGVPTRTAVVEPSPVTDNVTPEATTSIAVGETASNSKPHTAPAALMSTSVGVAAPYAARGTRVLGVASARPSSGTGLRLGDAGSATLNVGPSFRHRGSRSHESPAHMPAASVVVGAVRVAASAPTSGEPRWRSSRLRRAGPSSGLMRDTRLTAGGLGHSQHSQHEREHGHGSSSSWKPKQPGPGSSFGAEASLSGSRLQFGAHDIVRDKWTRFDTPCRYGVRCTLRKCGFTHPAGWVRAPLLPDEAPPHDLPAAPGSPVVSCGAAPTPISTPIPMRRPPGLGRRDTEVSAPVSSSWPPRQGGWVDARGERTWGSTRRDIDTYDAAAHKTSDDDGEGGDHHHHGNGAHPSTRGRREDGTSRWARGARRRHTAPDAYQRGHSTFKFHTANSVACRYGMDCHNPLCGFRHPPEWVRPSANDVEPTVQASAPMRRLHRRVGGEKGREGGTRWSSWRDQEVHSLSLKTAQAAQRHALTRSRCSVDSDSSSGDSFSPRI